MYHVIIIYVSQSFSILVRCIVVHITGVVVRITAIVVLILEKYIPVIQREITGICSSHRPVLYVSPVRNV